MNCREYFAYSFLLKDFLYKVPYYSLGASVRKKHLLFPFLLVLATSGFSFSGNLYFGVADAGTNVGGLITSSTTWTKANSPYVLTGPVAVNTGVTLTIEAGTFVNLNLFYIQVNGTLIANGTSSERVSIYWGEIIFTPLSNGWNELTGEGCIIENAILSYTQISSSNPLKLSNSTINKPITVGNSSKISYNNIAIEPKVGQESVINAGKASLISYNNASAYWITYNVGEGSVITDNIINGIIDGYVPSLTITNNTIFGSGGIKAGGGTLISNNYIWVGDIWGGTIIGNTINGNIFGGTVSNNTIYGTIHDADAITYNTVHGGISMEISGTLSSWVVTHNIISGGGISVTQYYSHYWPSGGGVCYNANISDNNVSMISLDCPMNATIERNIIASGGNGLYLGAGVNATAANNTVFSNNAGIMMGAGASSTIVNNIFTFNNVGISIGAGATSTIANNTFAFNNVGIRVGSSSQNISYNNFQITSGYNIYLSSGTIGNVDAINNWWGTTDTQAINQSMYDSKNDFNVGTVNFVPFLTASNTAAPAIPTFNILASAGTGGSISPSGSIGVSYGGNQTFTIAADTGYQIADVTVDGNSAGAVSSYNFTYVQADHTISATFAPTPTPYPSPSPTPIPSPSPSLTPTPTPSPTPTPTSTVAPSPSPSQEPTATPSPTPPSNTGIYLSTPLFYAIVIAIIALTATIAALIIKIKRQQASTL
jgi:parallel beta-helix repeat protein